MQRLVRAGAIANWLVITAVALGACVAAASAHVVIDVLGDFVVSRDAYDYVEHGSRATTAVIAGGLLLGCLAFSLWVAVVEVGGARMLLHSTLYAAVNRSPWPFIVAVIAGAMLVLIAMEALDTVLQYGRLDDFADLLGGSVWLALAVVVPVATVVALAARWSLRTLLRTCRALVSAVGSFFHRSRQRVAPARSGSGRGLPHRACHPSLISPHASRRGPPLSLHRRCRTT